MLDLTEQEFKQALEELLEEDLIRVTREGPTEDENTYGLTMLPLGPPQAGKEYDPGVEENWPAGLDYEPSCKGAPTARAEVIRLH